MLFYEKKNTIRWIIIAASFCIVLLILWNTYSFFQIFKTEERVKMAHWALAQKKINTLDLNADLELPLEIIQNPRIPIILAINDSIINTTNIDDYIVKDSLKIKTFLAQLKQQNDPIIMRISRNKSQYLYYGDSSLLNKLKYYPIALLLIIFLFATVVYNFYKSSKVATQNKLWAGMAKETAHQIGTPLSSLIGWLEFLKLDQQLDDDTIAEIEKDISRLQTITDRFSKIGSEPVLEKTDIISQTKTTYLYLKSRFSQQVHFQFIAPETVCYVNINAVLHSWTIENLMKNAIDAMKGKGSLKIEIIIVAEFCKINITDTGKGILKKDFKKIFEPGFTTKKRGWGLGLSLTKRIVEEYHNGKIKVLRSEIDKETTMQIVYKTDCK